MLQTILYVIGAALVIMAISLSGLILVTRNFENWTHKHIHHLTSFSAGVFLLVAVNLSHEALELAPSTFWGIGFIVAGALVVYLMSIWFGDAHTHHHSEDDHDHDPSAAKKLLIGDSIHNIADGIILAPAFFVDVKLGIAATVSIVIHEFVQEVSEFIVLKEAGYPTSKALFLNIITASTILIGAALGFVFASSNVITAVLLGVAAGIFFYTVIIDMFPHSIEKKTLRGKALGFLWLIVGALVIFGLNSFFGHEEAHSHGEEEGGVHVEEHEEEDHGEEENDHDDEEENHDDEEEDVHDDEDDH